MRARLIKSQQERTVEALEVCHARCRQSKNTSPFAPCNCRCGGLSHGSETLWHMRRGERAKAQAQMEQDLYRGQLAVEARVFLAIQGQYLAELTRRNGEREGKPSHLTLVKEKKGAA